LDILHLPDAISAWLDIGWYMGAFFARACCLGPACGHSAIIASGLFFELFDIS
jgi:hypothetical protein